MKEKKKKLKLFHKIFIGLGVGIITGLILDKMGNNFNPKFLASIMSILGLVGDLFLRLIKMVIVPLVFFSIISGVSNLSDLKKLKNVGVKAIIIFFSTAAIAITIGLIVAQVIQPGDGLIIGDMSNNVAVKELPKFTETLLNIIPVNPIASMAKGEMMHIISFSIFIGSALLMIGQKAQKLVEGIEVCSEVMFKIVDIVISFTPYGVFALMGKATATYGPKIFGPVAKFIVADYVSNMLVILLVYVPILILIARVNVFRFFRKVAEPWAIAFSTCTTSAALPVSLKVAEEDLGIPRETASFVLPLGATINMNGTGVYFGLIVMFATQIYGINLPFQQQALLVLQAAMLSVGCAAVPQSGLIISIALLTGMGLPLEGIALIAGIYRIVDQAHTSNNALGDLVTAITVASLEGDLDREILNDVTRVA